MRWRDMRRSSNVEDRRDDGGLARGGIRLPGGMPGRSTARRAGGGGIGMILIILVVSWLLGINPLTLLGGAGIDMGMSPDTGASTGRVQTGPAPSGDRVAQDPKADFVARVLGDTEDVWVAAFRDKGWRYEAPKLVLFTGRVQSACGFASAATGPFYCPGDKSVFIDLAFYEELKRRFEAPGDFAQAYVVAHEVGHHIQNVLGILPKFNEARRRMSEREANAMSVRVELQADCFAGVWGHSASRRGLLEEGDLEEALNAAHQIGDDALQRRTQGYVVPDSFNHGTSEQRMRWFRKGFQSGSLDSCDTFSVREL